MQWNRWLVGCVAIPVAFGVTCIFFARASLRIVDPMTHRPVQSAYHFPFPILVVSGEEARVEMMEEPYQARPPASGASYLVPLERRKKIERFIRDHDDRHLDGGWVLEVEELSPGRQQIELYTMGDGYWGGVYEATATTIAPLYRKIAGPGLAFVAFPLALLMNLALWGLGWAGGWMWIRRRRAAARPVESGLLR